MLGVDADDLGGRPYLTALPDTEWSDALIKDWLTSLMDDSGIEGTVAVLRTYREMDWYTETVEHELYDHLLGVPRRHGDGPVALDAADHLLGFGTVVRLATGEP